MLWNASNIVGYGIEASDGRIGGVDDFLIDERAWTVRWLVVNAGGWLTDRRVLLPPAALGEPDPAAETFPVRLTRRQVKESPDIELDAPVSRQHEMELARQFGPTFPMDRFHDRWPIVWHEIAARGLAVKPGVHELLAFAEERGLALGLTTSTARALALRTLGYGGFAIERFRVVVRERLCREPRDETLVVPDFEKTLLAKHVDFAVHERGLTQPRLDEDAPLWIELADLAIKIHAIEKALTRGIRGRDLRESFFELDPHRHWIDAYGLARQARDEHI
jgi:hypothetical protein